MADKTDSKRDPGVHYSLAEEPDTSGEGEEEVDTSDRRFFYVCWNYCPWESDDLTNSSRKELRFPQPVPDSLKNSILP